MNGNAARFVRLAVCLVVLLTLGWVLTGQAAKRAPRRVSLVTDWSHRHLIFSQPGTAEELTRVSKDPRYWQQMTRFAQREPERVPVPQDVRRPSISSAAWAPGWFRHHRQRGLNGLWSEDLGSGGALPANAFPAKYSFNINSASCASDPNPDFVVYSTGLSSSPLQASIVAYDNLYAGCTGTLPMTYWAYDTGGQILTSPAFSYDGKQIVFVQTNAGLLGTLVVLKWAPSTTETVGGPLTLVAVPPAAYQACIAPCMTTIILSDNLSVATDDRTSSVFYDYNHDIAWVGGTRGWLHKITGVFNGTPTEVHTAVFPVHLTGGSTLSSPVYDRRTTNVFVGDASGFLYSVDSSIGSFVQSGQLDFGVGIADTPIVDSAAQVVYAFASADSTTACTGAQPCAAVYQLSTSFTNGATGTKVQVGDSVAFPGTPAPLYSGGFDSLYIASRTATGNLYVCGNPAGTPIMYQVPVAGVGTFGTPVVLPQLSATLTTACSPVSDIPNPNAAFTPTDKIFVSTQNDGNNTNCAGGGCIFSFNVTPWRPNTLYPENAEILDNNGNIQAVTNVTGGRSGATVPTWNSTVIGGHTTDGTGITSIEWQLVGALSPVAPAIWQGSHLYTRGKIIVDSNNNLQLCNVPGTSGALPPVWNMNAGFDTPDGSGNLKWLNLGANPAAALATTGGTSGIILDNVVNSITLTGTSQVYFSTLGSQACVTSGGSGSCAIQASQTDLK